MKYDEMIISLLKKAEELKFAGEHEQAIKELQQVLIAEPNCFEAFEEIADNYISLREPSRAEKALNQAVKVNKDSSNAHYLLGFLYSLNQRWKESVGELEMADSLLPNHPEVLRCLGWSTYNLNRKSQKGIAILERSLNLSPADVNILCDLGVCYMNSQLYLKAIPVFEKVIKISPNSDQAKECRTFLNIIKEANLQ